MKYMDITAVILVIVGALNWGLVGLFRFDLLAALLGDATFLSRLVYVVVGAAGLFLAIQWKSIHDRWVRLGLRPAGVEDSGSVSSNLPPDEMRDRLTPASETP